MEDSAHLVMGSAMWTQVNFEVLQTEIFMMPRFWESGKEKKEIRENFPG